MNTDRILTLALLATLVLNVTQQWQLARSLGSLQAGIGQLSSLKPADLIQTPPAGDITNTATGNTVTVNTDSALPASPRTVEQVANYLGVTPDTVRESYIPAWIEAGHMTADDRAGQRWLIAETFVPYRPH